MKNKTVKDIVSDYLRDNGYDGLYADSLGCGCVLKNLMPCNRNPSECRVGYKKLDLYDAAGFIVPLPTPLEAERLTPNEWLKDPRLHGIKIIDPDGWDRKNFEEDWAKPLTLAEMRDKVNISTCLFSSGLWTFVKETQDL